MKDPFPPTPQRRLRRLSQALGAVTFSSRDTRPPFKRMLFNHIPKTGGITVLTHLKEVYAGRKILELRGQNNTLQTVQKEELRDAEFIWLHAPLREMPHPTHAFYRIVFLRNPEERVRSAFLYLRNPEIIRAQDFTHVPRGWRESLHAIEHMTFEHFVTSEDTVYRRHTENAYAGFFAAAGAEAMQTRDAFLKSALWRLKNCFDFVGLTETLSSDLPLLKAICYPGSPVAFNGQKLNQSKKEGVDLRLSERAAALLREKIRLDCEIYALACGMRAAAGLPTGGVTP
jgi:hypothetical protein